MIKLITLAALLLIPASVFAQGSPPAEGTAGSRALGGHAFLPSDVVEDPFAVTYFDESTGFGYATFRASQVDSSGNVVGTSQFQFGTLAQQFKFQLGIQDSWAVRLAAVGLVFSGVDADSALVGGATVAYSLDAGATYSFMLGDLRLGGALDLEFAPAYTFSPLAALVSTIGSGKIDTSTLFTSSESIRIRPAVLMALALNRSLGLRAQVNYEQEYVRSAQNSSDGTLNLGAAVDYDFHAATPLPLGLVAGYMLSVPSSGTVWGHEGTVGLFYTGQRNLGLGIQAFLQLPPAPAGASNYYIFAASLTLRYYWS